MQSQEWIEMLRVIPPDQHNQVVLVLQNGSELAIDTLFRFEPNFLVARGRVAGSTDENRAFFVPYSQMLYYRLERNVKLEELTEILGSRVEASVAAPIASNGVPAAPAVAPTAPPALPADPAVARNALLERIRAARANQPNSGSSSSSFQ